MELMYITNDTKIAIIAEHSGVDRLWIDMEWMGKDKRQFNMDTVKSHHTLDDISRIKRILNKSSLMVRVNPIHSNSRHEVSESIKRGADIVMLPMWKTLDEVKQFIDYVDGRAKVNLLLETAEARSILPEVIKLQGIDEIHIGLNDLHLSYGKSFMFELLADGTVDEICSVLKCNQIKYGFGGIGRIGAGVLPAEHILAEHVRLNSKMVILSRSFCQYEKCRNYEDLSAKFESGVHDIRKKEIFYNSISKSDLNSIHEQVKIEVQQIVRNIQNK